MKSQPKNTVDKKNYERYKSLENKNNQDKN